MARETSGGCTTARAATRSGKKIAELRGARIFADARHGCALVPDCRVACFDSSEGFSVADARLETVRLTDVPALRGTGTLHLEQNRTCGWMPRDRLLCVGTGTATGMPRNEEGAQPAALDVERLVPRAPTLRRSEVISSRP